MPVGQSVQRTATSSSKNGVTRPSPPGADEFSPRVKRYRRRGVEERMPFSTSTQRPCSTILFTLAFVMACDGLSDCGGGDPSASSVSVAPAEPVPEGPAPYEVHEWGLVDFDARDGCLHLAAGPRRLIPSREPADILPPIRGPHGDGTIGKPVVYFHADAGYRGPVELRVVSPAPFVEVDPVPQVEAGADFHAITWSGIEIGEPGCNPPIRPYPDSAECRAVSDGVCERAELNRYIANDARCVRIGYGRHPLLFYRASGSLPVPPVRVSWSTEQRGHLEVHNAGLSSPSPVLVWVRKKDDRVFARRAAFPARGASVVLAPPTDHVNDERDARELLAEPTRAMGLTEDEARAFSNAWRMEILWASKGNAASDVVLYYLPEADIEAYARLELSPPPRRVVRVMAVRTNVPPL